MAKLSDFTQDTKNANRGTDRGNKMLQASLREHGAGRSALVDKDGNIIAGNKTLAAAEVVGLTDCIVVDSDGTKPIVVRRTDLSIDDPKARQLALADNRIAEVNLDWDLGVIEELKDEGVNLEGLWTKTEIDALAEEPEELKEKVIELKPQTFIRVLISVPVESGLLAQKYLDALGKVDGIEVEYGAN